MASPASGRKPKRSSMQIREDQKRNGAFPIEIHFPEDRAAALAAAYKDLAAWGSESNQEIVMTDSWGEIPEQDYPKCLKAAKRLASKGFVVTHSGCLLPDKRWCTKGKGSTVTGHQVMFSGMYGITTVPLKKGAAGADKAAELQHGCHCHACANPDHIWLEPAFRNRKRNYCVPEGNGQCSCKSDPPCLEPYASSHVSKGACSTAAIGETDICKTWPEVTAALKKHRHSLSWSPSTWEKLGSSDAREAHKAQKNILETVAKRRKAQRAPDENTPGTSEQPTSPTKKKQKIAGSQPVESSKIANRKAREKRAQQQAWSCARKAAARAAKNFSRRFEAEFRASFSHPSRESAASELGVEVEKAAREAYLNHLQVPLE